MIQLSEFFQYSFVLILKRKCLVGASRVRCQESGTPSTIIYTRWSSRRYELGCDAPVFTPVIHYININITSQAERHSAVIRNADEQCWHYLTKCQVQDTCGCTVTFKWHLTGPRQHCNAPRNVDGWGRGVNYLLHNAQSGALMYWKDALSKAQNLFFSSGENKAWICTYRLRKRKFLWWNSQISHLHRSSGPLFI